MAKGARVISLLPLELAVEAMRVYGKEPITKAILSALGKLPSDWSSDEESAEGDGGGDGGGGGDGEGEGDGEGDGNGEGDREGESGGSGRSE
eukprot:5467802-Prymnesium_polylepis.1